MKKNIWTRGLLAIVSIAAVLIFVIVGIAYLTRTPKEDLPAESTAASTSGPRPTIVVQVAPDISVSVDTVEEVMSQAAELVSYKYYYKDTDVYEKDKVLFQHVKVPFTKDKTIFTYSGVISVGVDLSDANIEVDDEAQSIDITLPALKVIAHEINDDEFETFDVKDSVFTQTSLGEYAAMMDTLKKQQELKLRSNQEFWDQAKDSAERTILSLVQSSSQIENYSVKVEWKES